MQITENNNAILDQNQLKLVGHCGILQLRKFIKSKSPQN